MENIFERGCLVQFSASVWGATRKIDLGKYVELDSSPEWLRANKKLVHPDALKPMQKIVNATRGYLMRVSLPFPLNSMVFVPKDMINGVDQRLNNFKKKFEDQVRVFVNSYDHLRETAITNLGDLFNQFDYPVDISAKFSFAWRFIVLDVPNGKSGILSPEVYAREKEKFVRTMEEARQMAIDCLREEFSSMVERVSERFNTGPDGKPKVFKNATINNFYEYFETFKERNIFRDEELTELVSRAQEILGGASAESIRSNGNLRQRIAAGMSEVEQAMENILVKPRRKITMN